MWIVKKCKEIGMPSCWRFNLVMGGNGAAAAAAFAIFRARSEKVCIRSTAPGEDRPPHKRQYFWHHFSPLSSLAMIDVKMLFNFSSQHCMTMLPFKPRWVARRFFALGCVAIQYQAGSCITTDPSPPTLLEDMPYGAQSRTKIGLAISVFICPTCSGSLGAWKPSWGFAWRRSRLHQSSNRFGEADADCAISHGPIVTPFPWHEAGSFRLIWHCRA